MVRFRAITAQLQALPLESVISLNAAFNHRGGGCNLHLHFPPRLIIPADSDAASQSDTLTSFRGFMGLVKMVCQYAHTNMMKMTWYTSKYTTESRKT